MRSSFQSVFLIIFTFLLSHDLQWDEKKCEKGLPEPPQQTNLSMQCIYHSQPLVRRPLRQSFSW
eukprot:m.235989 g.235989  ORF g.235989 m.235989 type:complete len:64 (+) comp26539_c0_seq2:116-307(+)